MHMRRVRLLLACGLILAASPLPASAQFGLPGLPGGGRGPLPLPFPGPGLPGPGRVLVGPGVFPIMPFGRGHRAFGIIGAVAVGGIILGRMSRRDGVEVTRRTKVVLDKDRDREVVDTYQTKDGGSRVTITAAPVQRISDIKDDPVLKQTADTVKQAGAAEKQNTKGKKETTTLDSEFLKVDQLPADTQCRKVTTELENKNTAKKGAKQLSDSKSSNTSILCQTSGGEWKPAST
jgi:hypothetical protein